MRMKELQQYLRNRSSLRPINVDLLLELGDLHAFLGGSEDATRTFSRALTVLSDMDDRHRRAVVQGRLADLLHDRRDLEAALRIHTEEELPVYQELGDERSRAIAQSRIAEILQARGELDEALRIRMEEELPVFERMSAIPPQVTAHARASRLGDVRSRAVSQGRIADLMQTTWGGLDEALRIRTEQQVPIFVRWPLPGTRLQPSVRPAQPHRLEELEGGRSGLSRGLPSNARRGGSPCGRWDGGGSPSRGRGRSRTPARRRSDGAAPWRR